MSRRLILLRRRFLPHMHSRATISLRQAAEAVMMSDVTRAVIFH